MKRTAKGQCGKEYPRRKKDPKRNRLSTWLVLFACLLTAMPLGGCGDAGASGADESIELHEPGTGSVTAERAAVRDLYIANVYEGGIYPYVEEYSFETTQRFGYYGALYGEEVQKGDVLFTADEEALAEEMKSLREQMESLTKEYERYCRKQEEELYEMRGELERLGDILNNLNAQKPKETILNGEGQEVSNPDYAAWLNGEGGYQYWQGQYSLKAYYVEVAELELQQKRELYDLDYGYYNRQLADLKEEQRKGTVTSGISGRVVAMQGGGGLMTGEIVSGGEPVLAVANLEELFLKCDYVGGAAVENAADVYAMVNGERIEVAYLESEDRRLSTFSIEDKSGRVEAGDYAVLVLVSDYRKNVLTVPAQSVYREGSDKTVYVVEDGITVTKKVETGMSDGVYIEILSGLKEGDRVVAQVQKAGEKTAVLEKTDVRTEYRAAGSLYYPTLSVVENTVENGTVRFVEYRVDNRSYVEKGTPIAAISVEGDSAELVRREREVQRARERLADQEAALDMTREENVERIEDGWESIRKQEEELRKLKSDYATTEILAEASGYVYLGSYSPGDKIEPGEILGYMEEDRVTYLALGISSGELNYGNVVEITYPDAGGGESTAEGKVLTVGNLGLSTELAANWIIVEMPAEMQENMGEGLKRMYTVSFRTMPVIGSLKNAGSMIRVPLDAVTLRNGRTYVNVLEEDGSVVPMGFLAGGKDSNYYWVIDGLTEGMKICWE